MVEDEYKKVVTGKEPTRIETWVDPDTGQVTGYYEVRERKLEKTTKKEQQKRYGERFSGIGKKKKKKKDKQPRIVYKTKYVGRRKPKPREYKGKALPYDEPIFPSPFGFEDKNFFNPLSKKSDLDFFDPFGFNKLIHINYSQ